ncbi:MAG: DUF2752 domain-containing protein [Saprospirales bacterium]|nr:MAG: DUF2752 domain-containing protein [Saprospirales bacterium]
MGKILIGMSLILVLGYLIVLSYVGIDSEIGAINCPLYSYTGLECAGCGSQRAFLHLLSFEYREAFLQNPILFILLPYLILGFVFFYFKRVWSMLPERLGIVLFSSKAAFVVLFILILWTIVRNI